MSALSHRNNSSQALNVRARRKRRIWSTWFGSSGETGSPEDFGCRPSVPSHHKHSFGRYAEERFTNRRVLTHNGRAGKRDLHVAFDEPFYELRADWTYSKMRSVVLFVGIAPDWCFLCADQVKCLQLAHQPSKEAAFIGSLVRSCPN
jgi:hypothetical protein